MAEKYYQPNLFFDAWSKGTHVKDPSGHPRTLYHGTKSKTIFTAFDIDNPSMDEESWYGRGIYLTSNPEDASHNYALPNSPDFEHKVSRRAEEIVNFIQDELNYDEDSALSEGAKYGLHTKEQIESDDAYSIAEEHLRDEYGEVPRTIPLYVRLENPAIVSPGAPRNFYIELNEDTNEETGPGLSVYNTLVALAEDYGFDGQMMWEGLGIYDEFNYWDIENPLRDSASLYNDVDIKAGEFIKEFYQRMGHDGIILDAAGAFKHMDYVTPGTQHYILWSPAQVKSSIGNTGFYDPENASILAEDINEKLVTAALLDHYGLYRHADTFDSICFQ